MIRETAKETRQELIDLTRNKRRWGNVRMRERDTFGRRRAWYVAVDQRQRLTSVFDIPDEFVEYSADQRLTIRVDASEDRAQLIFDDGEYEEVELTEEEQTRRELERSIREEFDVERSVAEILADEFDSVTEILDAERSELLGITGIGENRARKIQYRHSGKLKERLKNREGAVPAIEDKDGVLRLPEKFEGDEHEPNYSSSD